jgi:hypothetical protein
VANLKLLPAFDRVTKKETFMEKGKLVAVALIGILLAVGLVMASCGNDGCTGSAKCLTGPAAINSGGENYSCDMSSCVVAKAYKAGDDYHTKDLRCDCD